MSGNERSNMEPNVHNVNVKTSEESGKFQIRLLIGSHESYRMPQTWLPSIVIEIEKVISLQRQSTLKHPRPLVPDVSTNDPSVREDNQERFKFPKFPDNLAVSKKDSSHFEIY